jgi:hypothetical protein
MLLLLQVGAAGDAPAYPAYTGESRGYEGEPELEEPDLGIDTQAAVCGVGGVGGAVVPRHPPVVPVSNSLDAYALVGPHPVLRALTHPHPPVVPVANSLDAARETGNMCNIYIYICIHVYIHILYICICICICIYIYYLVGGSARKTLLAESQDRRRPVPLLNLYAATS